MNELKEFVTEGFINVLKNRKCAEVYGIKLLWSCRMRQDVLR